MKQPKISVIVPIYNLEKELPRCLDSICAQTYTNMEIIPVDDGSRDGSRAVIEQYTRQDSRIKPIYKENGGVTSARLCGISSATGDWVGFIDGDDEIEPDMYARLLHNAHKFDADISHCGYQMIFNDGRIHYFHNSGQIREQDPVTAIRDLLEGTLVEPGQCNKLYRRTLFSGLTERIDTTIRINEDLLMNYYLFKAATKAVFEDWCPYHYIVRRSSASRAGLNEHKAYDPIRVKELIVADADPELHTDALRALASTCVHGYCGMVCADGELARTARKKIRSRLLQIPEGVSALPSRARLLAALIIRTPWLFRLIYPVYRTWFQKKKYD